MGYREGELAAHQRSVKILFEIAHLLLERVLAVGLHARPGRWPSGTTWHEPHQGSFQGLTAHLMQARRTNAELLACLVDGHVARERSEHGAQPLLQILGPLDAVDVAEPNGRTP
ncbi:MAG: hypothetical protein ACRD1P_09090 [Thermoanaerobaculia bacterium]